MSEIQSVYAAKKDGWSYDSLSRWMSSVGLVPIGPARVTSGEIHFQVSARSHTSLELQMLPNLIHLVIGSD